MTRHDIIAHLNALLTGRVQRLPDSWRVDERFDGELSIEAEGERFNIVVSPSDEKVLNNLFCNATQEDLDAFARSLDEAADEAEREGPVPADELRRDLDEAKARGLRRWETRQRAGG